MEAKPLEIGGIPVAPTAHWITGSQNDRQLWKLQPKKQRHLDSRTCWQRYVGNEKVDLTITIMEELNGLLCAGGFDKNVLLQHMPQ
jgi:hypothetical protein